MIQNFQISQLTPYPDHPFKLYAGKRLDDMIKSIKEHGVIMPVIVRHIKGSNQKYEILSGHNRVNAAREAGFKEVPVIIRNDLTDAEAKLFVTETNLMQRSFADLSHSERALSLAQHYEAMKCQGKRNDLIGEIESLLNPQKSSSEIQTKTKRRSDAEIGDKYGLSRDKVAKYIRLSKLIPTLLELLNDGKIAFNPAYQLSFIEDNILQNQIAEFIQNGSKVDLKKSEQLKECFAKGNLTSKKVEQIISGDDLPKRKPFKISAEIINKYFKHCQSDEEIEKLIIAAMEFYNDEDDEEDEYGND